MVDRALTFADPEIVKMLKDDFVPVAIDQWYQRQQKDAEGEFYRKIAGQGPRKDFEQTTQGRYICTPDGQLLAYNNNRGPERIRALMKAALADFDPDSLANVQPIDDGPPDAGYVRLPPPDGLMLRVHCKVLEGHEPTEDWTAVFHDAIGRDNAWFTADEKKQLVRLMRRGGGSFPEPIALRIVRYHLTDFTRGEPPRWRANEVKSWSLRIDADGEVTGKVHLETADGTRGYQANLIGKVVLGDDEVVQFDLLAKGDFWGRGRFTFHAPEGRFPVAITFQMADGTDEADHILPHGAKGYLPGYYDLTN